MPRAWRKATADGQAGRRRETVPAPRHACRHPWPDRSPAPDDAQLAQRSRRALRRIAARQAAAVAAGVWTRAGQSQGVEPIITRPGPTCLRSLRTNSALHMRSTAHRPADLRSRSRHWAIMFHRGGPAAGRHRLPTRAYRRECALRSGRGPITLCERTWQVAGSRLWMPFDARTCEAHQARISRTCGVETVSQGILLREVGVALPQRPHGYSNRPSETMSFLPAMRHHGRAR